MTPVLTGAQMRAAERAAMDAGLPGATLMERAGAGVVGAALARWPVLAAAPGRAAVLCGPGANGGDGYVVARLLAGRGWTVAVHALNPGPGSSTDAEAMRARWAALGPVLPIAALEASPPVDLLVDALFGLGVARPLPAAASGPALAFRERGAAARTVAVDAPSGLCLDTGRAWEGALAAELTVTFHAAKPGHYLGAGPALCGALAVADIGLPPPEAGTVARLGAVDWPALGKRADQHKYDHGHLLVLAGGVGRGGAARLAARAGLRVGAGLVTVGAPPAAMIENAARLDAVMLRPVADPQALRDLIAEARVGALLLGPGLGVGERTRALALAALAVPGLRVTLDADALTSFADDPAPLFAACAPDRVAMTPHWGEFRRLFPDLAAAEASDPPASRLDVAQAAADRAAACVLLKGPTTVIAAPGAPGVLCPAVYEDAAPWLATAGSGDVLAGLLAGLTARGMAPAAAAETAALLHAAAGRGAGPGLIADDLPEAAAAALRAALGGGSGPPGAFPVAAG